MRSNIPAGLRQRVERLAGVAGERDRDLDLAELVSRLDRHTQYLRECAEPPRPPLTEAERAQQLAAATAWGRAMRVKMRAAGYRV